MLCGESFERLPSNVVVPLHYDIHIQPCLETCKFSGEETIKINVKIPTKSIQLHCLDIEIQEASLNDKKLEADTINYSEENESVEIFFNTQIEVGEHDFHLKFTGEVNDKLKGFYRSTYHSLDGEVKTCAITQFEATDARRCFPCWDEPAIKASFTCSLTIASHLLGLSNMPVVKETQVGKNLKRLDFGKTPISPTYLVAFFVGEADFVEKTTKRGVKVRVYTPLGKRSHGEFALQHAIDSLQFYEDYFKVDYPLEKLDMIALEDFCCGAMENWGLITYRATAILVDPETSSTETKMYVSIVVAHEIAHQWFGNLVTMEWWTYLWLNEGFAEFMEYLCTDRIHPEYEMFKVFIKDDFAMGMELDALDSSHPVEVIVKHPAEVDEIFDYISYKKGASIIRMLHNWIGDTNFR